MSKPELYTRCSRCTKPLQTSDEFATEKITPIFHRFYHWECVKKDKTLLPRLKRSANVYIEYNQVTEAK